MRNKPVKSINKRPTISVMMCAYNAEAYIQEAIKSVLNQTYKDFEFIIIDDGSTDMTLELIRQFEDPRIRVIRCHHDYINSLNRGLKACRGIYIARTDADDVMLPNRLKTQLDYMRAHPETAACFSWGTTFGSIQESIGHCAKGLILHAFFWLLTGNYLMHPSAMLRTEFMKQYHLRYKNYPYAEDYKLWADITRLGGLIYIIPKPLFKYRISKDQVSHVHHAEQNRTRLRIQQEILEELIYRLQGPWKVLLSRQYHMLLKLNQAALLQGDEVIVYMYKLLRRTKFFVQ